MQAHQLVFAPEVAEVLAHRQAGGTRLFPVADDPVDFLFLLPGDEGVAEQRNHVISDRAIDGVLKVDDTGRQRRLALDKHQVARHEVAVHEDLGLVQRRIDQELEGPVEHLFFVAGKFEAQMAADEPFGKEVKLAAQQRRVIGG